MTRIVCTMLTITFALLLTLPPGAYAESTPSEPAHEDALLDASFFTNGDTLHRRCRMFQQFVAGTPLVTDDELADMAQCIGYIQGVMDLYTTLRLLVDDHSVATCYPTGRVSVAVTIDLVMNLYRERPELRTWAASTTVLMALRRSWPCPARTAAPSSTRQLDTSTVEALLAEHKAWIERSRAQRRQQ